jgi:hypothetical protein
MADFGRGAAKRLNALYPKRLDDGLVHRALEKKIEEEENI